MATPPSSPGTTVGLSGTLTINGQQVTVNTGDFSKLKSQGVVFSLSAPVTLGTLDELIGWFNANFGTDIPSVDTIAGDLPTTPVDLQGAFNDILGGSMVLTALQINTNAGIYNLAFSYTLANPLPVLGSFLEFDALGLSITHSGTGSPP